MAKILKVIEILSESPNNWEEATQNVVAEASKTLRNIRSVYIKEFTATVENDKISNFDLWLNKTITYNNPIEINFIHGQPGYVSYKLS